MFNVVLKISVCLSVLAYSRATPGNYSSECDKINGTYRTFGISEGKPIVKKLANRVVHIDENVYFQCDVKANPEARIFWLYEGTFIGRKGFQNQYRYSACNETLFIKLATQQDSGRYTCRASNIYGDASSTHGILKVIARTTNVITKKEGINTETGGKIDYPQATPANGNNSVSSVGHCGIWCYTASVLLSVTYLYL